MPARSVLCLRQVFRVYLSDLFPTSCLSYTPTTGRPENQKVETVKELLFVVFDVVWYVLVLWPARHGCFTVAALVGQRLLTTVSGEDMVCQQVNAPVDGLNYIAGASQTAKEFDMVQCNCRFVRKQATK